MESKDKCLELIKIVKLLSYIINIINSNIMGKNFIMEKEESN
jgi:hypothetical protein